MTATPNLAPLRSAGRRVRHTAECQPEWAVIVLAAAGWVALLRLSFASHPTSGHLAHSAGAGSAGGMAGMPGMPQAAAWRPPVEAVGLWVVMTVAMMLPLTVPSLRHVARMVPRSARSVALATFCSAFVVAWLPGAALAVWIHSRLPVSAGIVAAAFVAAGAWELTSIKRTALLRCHRTAVIRAAQPGRRRTCWQYGLRRGAWCAASCGPLMVALALSGHTPLPLLLVSLGVTVQRYSPDAYRSRGLSAAGFSAIAVIPLLAL